MTTVIINLPSIPRITQNLHHVLLVLISAAGAAGVWAQADGPGIGLQQQYITYIALGSAVVVTLGRRLLNTPQPPPPTGTPITSNDGAFPQLTPHL